MPKCSPDCMFYKKSYRPYFYTECNRGKYYKKIKEGKYCKYFKLRESKMFKIKTKAEIVEKYIELLKIENKSEKDLAQIELLDWIFNKEKQA